MPRSVLAGETFQFCVGDDGRLAVTLMTGRVARYVGELSKPSSDAVLSLLMGALPPAARRETAERIGRNAARQEVER